jgi:hypothetical protein
MPCDANTLLSIRNHVILDQWMGGEMDSEVRDALVFMEKKLESIEEKIDTIVDAMDEFKEYIPATLDDDLAEIKSLLIQMT